ncbi:Hpt domain-containing protein, partial [Ferrovibrio terrae]|uniref:Hpt domain-containing protein n=1 Tax=Ferrovibrio terrae TaxID=2594003 RepID=UPI0031384010
RALNRMRAQWLPPALPRRRAATAAPVLATPAAPPVAARLDWDRDIFDPDKLGESFGAFNAAAKQLLQDFLTDAQDRVDAIATAQSGGDIAALRHLAHALKGGALTVGATRLGNLAADLQDACDADDLETAALMAELLPPTLDELTATLPLILKA